jgi:phage-related minor tail protein
MWDIVQPLVQPIVDWFTTTFAAVGQEGGAVDVVTQAFNALSTLLQSIWAAIEPGVTALANGINGVLQPVKDLIDGINAGFASLRGMGGIISEAQNAVAASGVDREALWQLALEQAGGNDLVARIVFGQLEGSLAGRAAGGPVSAGRPYLVGEAGAEIMVPRSSGYVIPNHALGGGGVTVVVNSYGQTPYDFATLVERALRDKGF